LAPVEDHPDPARLASRRKWVAAVVVASLALVLVVVNAATGPGRPARAFRAVAPAATSESTFDSGTIAPALQFAQCSNTGTPSTPPRLRGSLHYATKIVGQGAGSLRIDLPADTNAKTFPLEACNTETAPKPIGLGTDSYYGLMVYEPTGFTIPNTYFGGVQIEEFHFQNIFGSPVNWELHTDHITLALNTGSCVNHSNPHPTCAFRSNADQPNRDGPNLPAYYVIPPGQFVGGQWYELAMHVHWASDNTGVVQTWWKVRGAATWTASADVTGIPTVQFDSVRGCCGANYEDEMEAYTFALSKPFSVWLDNNISGPTLASVEASMP
jgi:hypothetical protein